MEGVIALVVVLGLAALWLQMQAMKRRVNEIEALCAARGWTFRDVDTEGLDGLGFWLTSQGHSKLVENVVWLRSSDDHALRLFDYQYTTGSGKNRATWRYTCSIADLPVTRWPRLRVTPETALDRLADHIGLRDLELESEEFNRAFEVETENNRFATAVLDPQMMQWLLESWPHACFEIAGGVLMIWTDHLEPNRWVSLASRPDELRAHISPTVHDLYPS